MVAGKVRVKREWGQGSIAAVLPNRVSQAFHRVPAESPQAAAESRFKHFDLHVLSQIIRLEQSHTLIVAPSYFDFVRIRNELIKREVSESLLAV
jgi:hypothetical protein